MQGIHFARALPAAQLKFVIFQDNELQTKSIGTAGNA